MKRVLIFSLAYYPQVGGAEIAIKEITDRISPSDIEFHMLTLRFGNEREDEKIGNVHVHRIGKGALYGSKIVFILRAARRARALHRAAKFDGFWAMMSYMVLPIVLLRMTSVRVPYLLTLQEGDPFSHVFSRWFIVPLRPLLRAGFRGASSVQAISKFLAGWAKREGFSGEVAVIPNGVDTKRFSQAYLQADIDAVKDALGKKMGDVFLITTSRLVHKNALDDCIRALPALSGNIRFLVLGIGPDEKMLKDLARKLDVAERVRFVGHVDHAELPKYLKACDIFIRPSRSEGMGNSFVEAMAAGLPVIATQEGGIADLLFDETRNPDTPTTGWAVDRDSPAQIIQAVKDVMNDPAKVRRVVATAQKMVEEEYDWNLIAHRMRAEAFAPVIGV